ncbi:MAG: hypothetical protein ACFHX7_11525 [Pseudomonadota bacterium]
MNRVAIRAIAELPGALALVGPMIYLAIQMAQDSLSNRVTDIQNATNQFTDFSQLMVQNAPTRSICKRRQDNSYCFVRSDYRDKRRFGKPFLELIESEIRSIKAATSPANPK